MTRRRGVVISFVGLINEVHQRWARLVLGWVTVLERVNDLGMQLGICRLSLP